MNNMFAVAPVDIVAASADFATWMGAAITAGFALYMLPKGVRFIKRAFNAGS
jgi:uncharacterized protein with NRDE domain